MAKTSLAAYVAGMKDFAFDANNNGSTWPGADVGVGGRAAFMDAKQAENGEGGQIPSTPVIAYTGPGDDPVNALTFTTSAFADPQGANSFGAVQWRMAEVNTSAIFTPGVPRLLEIVASYDSGEIAPFSRLVPLSRRRLPARENLSRAGAAPRHKRPLEPLERAGGICRERRGREHLSVEPRH